MKLAITGGTGSLGQALVDDLLDGPIPPEKIVIVSRDEVKQGDMAKRLAENHDDPPVRFMLGDVRDRVRLEQCLRGCDTVVHAAALKRVDRVAYDPEEVLKTNVLGTRNVLEAAQAVGIERVLVVSTDKAVAPANIYGATKLMAEHLAVAYNAFGWPRGTASSVVRYGNVWGSRGSVVEVWRKAAADRIVGGAILVTDDRVTRFVITLAQAVRLVRTCLNIMSGGEIFVPRLPSVRLALFAEVVAERERLPIKRNIGLRPGGEKIHEALLSEEEASRTVRLGGDLYLVKPSHKTWTAADWRGEPVGEAFRYTSDINTEWLSKQDILELWGNP